MTDIYQTETLITPSANCTHCKVEIKTEAVFCPSCGYPEKGTDIEKSKFIANNIMNKNEHFDADKKVKSARNTLYILAAATFVLNFIQTTFQHEELSIFVVNLILSVSFLVLGVWSKKKPLAALLSALLLYITIVIINGIFEPETLYQGILWKVLIISYLGKGVYSANAYQKQMQDNGNQ